MSAGDLVTLNTFSDPDYDVAYTLDGNDYLFAFKWNQRASTWYLAISDSSGNLIVASIPVVCGYPILFKYQYLAILPPGFLFVFPSGDDSPPQVTDFGPGLRCELSYFTTT